MDSRKHVGSAVGNTTWDKKNRGARNDRNPSISLMAGATRLELATFGVTGRRSNQLNYAPLTFPFSAIQ